MKKYCLDLTVVSTEQLSSRHVLLKLSSDRLLPEMIPGQFVQIRVDHSPTTFLRRPISINFVDRSRNQLWLLVAAVGAGTRELFGLRPGEPVNCILPLGKGFSLPLDAGKGIDDGCSAVLSKVLLVGGGVGVAPLLFQGQRILEHGGVPEFLLGARTAEEIIEFEMFRRLGTVHVTTEDGSLGEEGFVTHHSVLRRQSFDLIQTCGPKPMMISVARYAAEHSIDCEASLENLMACGIGACLCCVEKTTEGNLCVCNEGPVFNTRRLLW